MSAHRRGKKINEMGQRARERVILRRGAAAKTEGSETVWERALLFGGCRRRSDLSHFPFPVDQRQTLGGRDATAIYLPIDEERCQILHTLAGSHFLPVKVAMQLVAALRSMRADDMLQLSRHRPVEEGSNRCDVVELKLYNGRFRGWDFETEDQMTKEEAWILVSYQPRHSSQNAPVPSSELTRFHMCGPPDCNFEEIRESANWRTQLCWVAPEAHKMQVVIPTSTVQVQTETM